MLVKKIFATGLMLYSILCFGQNGTQTWLQDDKFQRSISIYDANGKAFNNVYSDVEGTPYFLEEWKKCNIVLSNNSSYFNVYLKLDLLNQCIHYMDSNKKEMAAQAGLIKEITIIDSSKNVRDEYKFQLGFPPINNQKETDYYQVLVLGKVNMLKYITKKIYQEKNDLSGEVKSRFVSNEEYFFCSKITIQKLKRDKSILDLMFDKRDQIADFVSTKKLNYKSLDDIRKIVEYYDSLF